METRESSMEERLLEIFHDMLSYLAAETLKAKKCGKNERAEKLSVAFKILSEEYTKIKIQNREEKK